MKHGWILVFGMVCMAQLKAETATLLQFQEQEPGIDPYTTRMLITADYVRVDDGMDNGNFVLFDRAAKTIYNVMQDNRSVLVVKPDGTVAVEADTVRLGEQTFAVDDAPAVGGKLPQGHRLMADDEICEQAVIVPDLLPEATRALVEFHSLLGLQSAATLGNTPDEFQTPCFLARHILAPAWQWQRGLVIQNWDPRGVRMELVDFQTGLQVDDARFVVPSDYQQERYLLP